MSQRDAAVVICKPFGYESSCAHRSLVHLGAAAAAAGFPALVFDYDGTGDSAGDDRDPGRWTAWLQSVHGAIDELRRAVSVQRVFLLGTRLGATLAASVAPERDDVAGLIGIVPVVSGRQWLREVNALEIAMRFAGPPEGYQARCCEQESVGFVITDETRADLQRLDLLGATRPASRDVLVIDRDDMPIQTKWPERLRALGASVHHRQVPGYAAMMRDPHESVVPDAIIQEVTTWLAARAGEARAPASRAAVVATVGPYPVAPGVEETAGYLNGASGLFGIVSAPAGAPTPRRAILLLNAGGNPHTGPSRLYVQLARRWAARGYLVLRFDQPGIGDSAPAPGDAENVVYSSSAVPGVASAIAHLRDRWGVTEFQSLGLCSGAYHSLKAAAAGLPLSGIAIVNPLVFFWKPGMSLAYPPYQVAGAAKRYQRAFLQWDKWKKLLSGRVSIRAFVGVMSRRAGTRLASMARDVARALGHPMRDDLGTELEAVARRGVKMSFVFATGDPGEDLLRTGAGSALDPLVRRGQLHITRIEGPNHAFTPVWTRDVLTDVLESELDVR